jgi:uncharacterized protein YxeA
MGTIDLSKLLTALKNLPEEFPDGTNKLFRQKVILARFYSQKKLTLEQVKEITFKMIGRTNKTEIRHYDEKGEMIAKETVMLSDEESDLYLKLREQGMSQVEAYKEVVKEFQTNPMEKMSPIKKTLVYIEGPEEIKFCFGLTDQEIEKMKEIRKNSKTPMSMWESFELMRKEIPDPMSK